MRSAVAEARRVLKPGRRLLDLHPLDEPNRLEVWHARYGPGLSAEPENLAGIERAPAGVFDQPAETLAEFSATTEALAEAVDQGLFALERSAAFDYRYFYDTLDELTDDLENDWEYATASDELLEKAARLMRGATSPPKLVVIQRVAITAMRKR